MDDPRWLRLITIGLVLAAMAIGYFLIAGKFSANKSTKTPSRVDRAVTSATPTPSVLGQDTQPDATPSATPASAYQTIVDRNQKDVQNLPNTGFPVGLIVVVSFSAMISGWSLSKFPD